MTFWLCELRVSMESVQASIISMWLALLPAALAAFYVRSRYALALAVLGSIIGQWLSPFVMVQFSPDATVRDRIIFHVAIDLPYAVAGALLFAFFGWWIDPNPQKRRPFKGKTPDGER